MTTLDVIGVRPKVLEILRERPTLSYSRIAGEVGVTRERVRQIAHENGYPSRQGQLKTKICPVCGDIYYTRGVYCSRSCFNKSRRRRIVVRCDNCGKLIERAPGTLRNNGNGKYFCSRLCFYLKRNKNKENHFVKLNPFPITILLVK